MVSTLAAHVSHISYDEKCITQC